MKLLHIDSSALGTGSVSRELSAALVRKFVTQYPSAEIRHRDLAADPLPHWTPNADGDVARPIRDGEILEEFLAADHIVIGAPMYNFGIPSQLKAWIDRIAVAGKTFRYTENGPQGLAGGKKVVIASSRGGIYSVGAAAGMDFQEAYLRTVLGFVGITDIEVIRAEGVNLGAEQRKAAIADAHVLIGEETLLAA